ncbi:hypothetical protein MAR_003203 [Mya arenaria]|uniref:Uncharacterized protein n=1 Tax=Mya arenaria TaxID=6604 RepID=A0ABY7G5B7_MYAAR|nr:hypothetical protein MAR_003203 [Mya arenaria]
MLSCGSLRIMTVFAACISPKEHHPRTNITRITYRVYSVSLPQPSSLSRLLHEQIGSSASRDADLS